MSEEEVEEIREEEEELRVELRAALRLLSDNRGNSEIIFRRAHVSALRSGPKVERAIYGEQKPLIDEMNSGQRSALHRAPV
ncbi:unnamed protein product [Merluccius merluccius]